MHDITYYVDTIKGVNYNILISCNNANVKAVTYQMTQEWFNHYNYIIKEWNIMIIVVLRQALPFTPVDSQNTFIIANL